MMDQIGEFLFGNIGEKIKKLAVIISVIGIIGSILLGIFAGELFKDSYLFEEYALPMSIAIILIGCLIFWLSSFILYGFGELIDLSADISYILSKFTKQSHTDSTKEDLLSELKKFKELLDSSTITQEEFDEKKRQLLGL